MIERFKLLTIETEVGSFQDITKRLSTAVRPPWSYTGEKEPDFLPGLKSTMFAYRDGKLPDANLWLSWMNERISIGNIVPAAVGSLTIADYNLLFDDFVGKFLEPAAGQMGLAITTTPAFRDISDWLGDRATAKLKAFSTLANKSSGHSHTSDHARWLDFIICAHVDRADLPVDVLQEWLVVEHHWPDTTAMDLASDYEQGRELLHRYDER